MIRIHKVSGDSLSPKYQDGDFVFSIKIPILFNTLKKGDVVVIRHPEYGIIIKEIEHIDVWGNNIYVVGKAPNSVDSRRFGAIYKSNIIGKVVLHFPNTGKTKR